MDKNEGKIDQNHQDKIPKMLRLNFRAKNNNCTVYQNSNFHTKKYFFIQLTWNCWKAWEAVNSNHDLVA